MKPPLVSLLIDEDVGSRRLLRVILEGDGYRVVEATNGKDGIMQAAQWHPDVVLLDLDLTDLDGFEVLRRIREWSWMPILVISARDGELDIITALDGGADDYVTKPFNAGELLARLRAARRHDLRLGNKPFYRRGSLEVDLVTRDVRNNGQAIKLTRTEYALLRLLVSHAGKVLTHRQLLTEVWGHYAAKATNYLRVYMSQLRSKIEPNRTSPQILLTELGVGYRLAQDSSETIKEMALGA